MLVLVVLVVNVGMVVLQGVMLVPMPMPSPDQDSHSRSHHQAGGDILPRQPFAQDRHGRRCADEGRRREVGGLPGRPDLPKGEEVKDDAQAVAEKPGDQGTGERHGARKGVAHRHRHGDVDAARDEGLHPGDGHRVPKRQSLAQVVVDRPGEARSRDGQHTEGMHAALARARCQEHATQHHRRRPGHLAPCQGLAEKEHRDPDGERRLQVEEERRLTAGETGETREKQKRPRDSTRDHHGREGRKVTPPERSLPAGPPERRDHRQADAGPEVEESGQHEGPAGGQEQLRERRAQPEEQGRPRPLATPRGRAGADMPEATPGAQEQSPSSSLPRRIRHPDQLRQVASGVQLEAVKRAERLQGDGAGRGPKKMRSSRSRPRTRAISVVVT